MHRQIGNAVPMPISIALGRELRQALFEQWVEARNKRRVEIEDDE